MSLADDLLGTAQRLIATPSASEADLRRAVSTAYYALFHCLIEATASSLLSDADQQHALARRFSHTEMKKVCQLVTKSPIPPPAAPFLKAPVPVELAELATMFVDLQKERHKADYDVSLSLTLADARKWVTTAEDAFARWAHIQSAPIAKPFLLLLLIGEPPSR